MFIFPSVIPGFADGRGDSEREMPGLCEGLLHISIVTMSPMQTKMVKMIDESISGFLNLGYLVD